MGCICSLTQTIQIPHINVGGEGWLIIGKGENVSMRAIDWGDVVFGVEEGAGDETVGEHVIYYFFT